MMTVIIVAFVTLILLLFTPIELIISKREQTKIKARFWFIYFNIPKLKAQGFNYTDVKCSVKPLYCAIKYLLGKSRVTVHELVFLNVFDLAEKTYPSILRFITASVILTLLSEMAGEYKYHANRYVITEQNTEDSELKISIRFLLFRLIISLILVAYYKMYNANNERRKNVRKQNE